MLVGEPPGLGLGNRCDGAGTVPPVPIVTGWSSITPISGYRIGLSNRCGAAVLRAKGEDLKAGLCDCIGVRPPALFLQRTARGQGVGHRLHTKKGKHSSV